MLKLVFCSGLWVIVFAESSSDGKTSSIDDSQDSASKHNAEWLKSRAASRDMSYSSSFGSEDFDSPDIPSDFHARWGANKSWYVKTPHPILSRRESFEEYGRAPVVLESEEEDSSEPTEPSVTGDSTVTLADAVETPATVSNNAEEITSLRPSMKWRIRGRASHTRPLQRAYVNFRMRPPPNVGRSFGPPDPPFPPPGGPQFRPPFAQRPYPRFPQAPFPPYPPRPPPPPPPPFGPGHRFGHMRPPGQFVPPPPPPPHPPMYGQPTSFPEMFRPPFDPRAAPSLGPRMPPVDPFGGAPTVGPEDGVPVPWPRRQEPFDYGRRPALDTLPESGNFSGYRGPRRGRGYEQFGKADLRPRQVRFMSDFPQYQPRPRFPSRRGAGFGADFQESVTRPGFSAGELFERREYNASRFNKYGYAPYRRTADRRRPYGFGRFAEDRPPVLGDFDDNKPYRRLDNARYVSFNYSRPTRSYTFPPRLRLAIRNASYYRRTFRRAGYQRYTLPTLPSIGLEAYLAHDHDYYGNLITPKGRIMNLQDLKKLFTYPPDQVAANVSLANVESPLYLDQSEDDDKVIKPRLTKKPKGMTAREAMRAAAREAIREAEAEAYEAGGGDMGRGGRGRGRGRGGWRGVGGGGGRPGAFIRRGGARGSGGRSFRRAKRSIHGVEEEEWSEQRRRLRRSLAGG